MAKGHQTQDGGMRDFLTLRLREERGATARHRLSSSSWPSSPWRRRAPAQAPPLGPQSRASVTDMETTLRLSLRPGPPFRISLTILFCTTSALPSEGNYPNDHHG